MSLDHLLIWMSARGGGSWTQFRGAVEELCADGQGDDATPDEILSGDLPIYHQARLAMQALAHAEFHWDTDRKWRVVPPSIAIMKIGASHFRGVVCGARTPGLSKALAAAVPPTSLTEIARPNMPTAICLEAENPDGIHTLAASTGLAVQEEASSALLAVIPPVDDRRSRYPAEPPSGEDWRVDRFSSSSLSWQEVPPASVGQRTDLLRYQMGFQRFYYLMWKGRPYSVQVQVGKYAVLRRRRVRRFIEWSQSELLVPVPLRPPPLVERALVLCSGLLPRLDEGTFRLVYEDVPRRVARVVSAVLRQELVWR